MAYTDRADRKCNYLSILYLKLFFSKTKNMYILYIEHLNISDLYWESFLPKTFRYYVSDSVLFKIYDIRHKLVFGLLRNGRDHFQRKISGHINDTRYYLDDLVVALLLQQRKSVFYYRNQYR